MGGGSAAPSIRETEDQSDIFCLSDMHFSGLFDEFDAANQQFNLLQHQIASGNNLFIVSWSSAVMSDTIHVLQ